MLATELAFEQHRFTGQLDGENCWGPQKVVRLRQWWADCPPLKLFAYGDSRGDKEMAELADWAWIRGQGPLRSIDE